MSDLSFATFSKLDGNPVAINAATVASFSPSNDNTQTELTTGQSITVRESFDVVAELLGAEGPTGC